MSDEAIDPRRPRAPTAPKRVSQRRYLIRRAGAVAVVVVAGFGLARVAALVGGEDDPPADAAPITIPTSVEPAVGGGGGAAGVAATTTLESVPDRAMAQAPARSPARGGANGARSEPESTPAGATADDRGADTAGMVETADDPTTAVAPDRTPVTTAPSPPTAAEPARVLVIGDSFAGLWGPPLEDLLEDTGVVEVKVDHEASTGLARPRRYDWFARAREQLAAVDPDVVVTSFGGNDFVPLADGEGAQVVGDPVANRAEWVDEYQRRAGAMMDLLAQDGRTVVWVGTANHPDPTTSAGLAVQDSAAKAAAAERPHVVLIDTWNLFAGRSGGWAPYVVDPRDNTGVDVRIEDGFHPNAAGAELLAAQIDPAVRAALGL